MYRTSLQEAIYEEVGNSAAGVAGRTHLSRTRTGYDLNALFNTKSGVLRQQE